MSDPVIVWFRQDLRLHDNPALAAAAQQNTPLICLYLWSRQDEGRWPAGGASKWWLHQSLKALSKDLESKGAYLILRSGESLAELLEIARGCRAESVFFNRRYEPQARQCEERISSELPRQGIKVRSFNAALLAEPTRILNKEGRPFRVFTSYWHTFNSVYEPDPPLAAPQKLIGFEPRPASLALADLALEPRIDWAHGIANAWQPGEAGGHRNLKVFLAEPIDSYKTSRDRPDQPGVSRLSPYLHFGEISPRLVWQAVKQHAAGNSTTGGAGAAASSEAYLRQLGWREFANQLLYYFPHTALQPLRQEFAALAYRQDANLWQAWTRGMTGYPIVDAGMRELWTTGWLHNRVRMIVASFLVKDLLFSWQAGAQWFWDTLVDADLANNTLGWQWTAGCGADAAPYFRIFNPVTQGMKFDPDGLYVRKWVPELARLSNKLIHIPWKASEEELKAATVTLGVDYPGPVVDHAVARRQALAALKTAKAGSSSKSEQG